MDQKKRKLDFHQSSEEHTKKFRNELDRSVNSIENLSNEFFYEIFDYLDSFDIYEAFSNLNYRFNQLLHSPSLLLKIKCNPLLSDDVLINNWKQMIRFHRQQIVSMNFWMSSYVNGFVSFFYIDSSLDHLQSLVLDGLQPYVLMQILFKLNVLTRLISLSIYAFNDSINLTDIYRIILRLSTLKHFKFTTDKSNSSLSLPIATNKQISPLEYLRMDHSCTFEQLSAIVSYMPQLRRLNLMDIFDNNPNIGIISTMTFSSLTDLSINAFYIAYDTVEVLIRKLPSQLKVLRINQSQDIAYLNAHRWEQLICQYFPQLKIFSLHYHERPDEEDEYPIYSANVNEFSSSFWIERRWIFEAEIALGHIRYSIDPYKTRWYDHAESSIDLSKSARFILTYPPNDEDDELAFVDIKRVLAVEQIYHLEISEEFLFIGILIQVINVLSELSTLKLHSLSLDQPRNLCFEEMVMFCSTESTSKITKVFLGLFNDIKDLHFLMALCPYMTHMEIDHLDEMDAELFLRNILKRINHPRNGYLRSLRFHVPVADDQIVEKLDQMIRFENLLVNYSMKRVLEYIHLQWK